MVNEIFDNLFNSFDADQPHVLKVISNLIIAWRENFSTVPPCRLRVPTA